VFPNLAPNSYNVSVEDTGDATCNDAWSSNPVVIAAGTDITAPVISCPANVTLECGDDTSQANTGSATATDACDPAPVVAFADSSLPGCGNTEVITRTWTATDASTNSSTCTQIITVLDTVDPVISCPVDMTLECGDDTSPANTGTATGTDLCGAVTVSFVDTSSSGCGNTEVITRTWTATDECSNTTTCSQVITVLDTVDPTISCPSNMTVSNDPGLCEATVTYSVPTGSDTCGTVSIVRTAGPSSGSAFPVGTTIITYEATDDCGNTASCSFNIVVNDTEDPVIVCPANQTVDPGSGNQYTVPDYFGTSQATVTDNCTNPVTITTQNPSAGTMLSDGVYTVTLTAEDSAGNTTSCMFTLTVDTTLGLNDNGSGISGIGLYPNPASNSVVLSNPFGLSLESVEIYNIQGKLIRMIDLTTMGSEKTIDLSDLASANYIVEIRGLHFMIVRQLVKE
jgi:hypothetical protein